MAAATTVSVIGFGIAALFYARGFHPFTEKFAAQMPWRWLHSRVLGKWHVDELYEVVMIGPLVRGSRAILYQAVDLRVVDGMVNLVGWLGRSLGAVAQIFHAGDVQRYLAIFVLGLALFLYGWLHPALLAPDAPDPEVAAVEALR